MDHTLSPPLSPHFLPFQPSDHRPNKSFLFVTLLALVASDLSDSESTVIWISSPAASPCVSCSSPHFVWDVRIRTETWWPKVIVQCAPAFSLAISEVWPQSSPARYFQMHWPCTSESHPWVHCCNFLFLNKSAACARPSLNNDQQYCDPCS